MDLGSKCAHHLAFDIQLGIANGWCNTRGRKNDHEDRRPPVTKIDGEFWKVVETPAPGSHAYSILLKCKNCSVPRGGLPDPNIRSPIPLKIVYRNQNSRKEDLVCIESLSME